MSLTSLTLTERFKFMVEELEAISVEKRELNLNKIVPAVVLPLLFNVYGGQTGAFSQALKSNEAEVSLLFRLIQLGVVRHYHMNKTSLNAEVIEAQYRSIRRMATRDRITDTATLEYVTYLIDQEQKLLTDSLNPRPGQFIAWNAVTMVSLKDIFKTVKAAVYPIGLGRMSIGAAWHGQGTQFAEFYADLNRLSDWKPFVDKCIDHGRTPKALAKPVQA
ncbi:MAG TPA: hypothetical protein VIN59_03715 [Alphaproteobacteria bacterium]